MLFSSLLFLYAYLPIVLLVYYSCPKRYRNGCLFLVSLMFYGWQEPLYICIMLISISMNYMFAQWIHRYQHQKNDARRWLMLSIIMNIALLGFFKYYTFLASMLPFLPALSITLPVGISFYTFQTMSYPIDVYRNDVQPTTSFTGFGMYVTMFPQLIAGPIVRYKDIASQIVKRTYTYERFYQGILRFVCGLSKKVLLANPLGALWEQITQLPDTQGSVLLYWVGILAFALQLYFDFSGYSDMAIGLGRMLGFQLPENFRYPYLAKSMREFWQRWHITLGSWFKSYVYIPLGGSHHGTIKTIRNTMIVWFLTGLWHGAGFNFICWGMYCGGWILLERYVLATWLQKHRILSHLYFLGILLCGWVFFASDSLTSAIAYFRKLFFLTSIPLTNAYTWYLIGTNLVLFLIALPSTTHLFARWMQKHHQNPFLLCLIPVFVVLLLLLCTSAITTDTYNPFLYFRF